MGMGAKIDLKTGEDLSRLAQPLTKSLSTPSGAGEQSTKEISEVEVDLYDTDRAKKRLIVQTLEILKVALLSKQIGLLDRARLGLAAMAQWEGTKRIIEWDKRVKSDADLLKKAENISKQLSDYVKKLPPSEQVKARLEVAAAMVGEVTKVEGPAN